MAKDFLVELGCEELPPKALQTLSEAFGAGIEKGLQDSGIEFSQTHLFASPRRLTVFINGVMETQANKEQERQGPTIGNAFDADGIPTKAAEGFARSCGVRVGQLRQKQIGRVTKLVFTLLQKGKPTTELLVDIVNRSLSQLPIPKRMRWGSSRIEFVRPVQWLLILFGSEVVDCEILGIKSGNQTTGHRFHANEKFLITAPADYENILRTQGLVIADFSKRQELIQQQVEEAAKALKGHAVISQDLLHEVTALNEWPVVLTGHFDEEFLQVPAEALISSMKSHQKYFHVVDDQGKLLPNFIFICNIDSKDPNQVVAGNERVIRPRLADAAFFFNTDKKQSQEQRRERLKPVIFQKELGTVYEKTQRVAELAAYIAEIIDADPAKARRTAELCKADLVSDMVVEFTDLQGIMGCYYAINDGEDAEVAQAIREHYQPRFSGDTLPETASGIAVALVDRIDSLVGLFGINQPPSGSKDPFGLRRASLGILRIILEKELPLNLSACLQKSADLYEGKGFDIKEAATYIIDRFSAWYQEQGLAAEVFLAVRHCGQLDYPLEIDRRVQAVKHFNAMSESGSLAEANKRVANILKKQEIDVAELRIDESLFCEDQEKALAEKVKDKQMMIGPLVEKSDYQGILITLVDLKETVDSFFDHVMVMHEDEKIRHNRLALLYQLRGLFLKVADISYLTPP